MNDLKENPVRRKSPGRAGVRLGRPPKEREGEVEERILNAARKVFLEHGSSRNSPDSNTRAARNQTSENYSCHSRAWIVRVYKVFDGGELFLASRIVKNIVRQVRNREMYWGLPLLVSPNWLFRRVPYRLSVFVQHCVLIIVFECTLVDSCDIKV